LNFQDWDQFGKEVSALETRLMRLEASIASQIQDLKNIHQN
jgi:uncharacterized coiled-coil protein SlyX